MFDGGAVNLSERKSTFLAILVVVCIVAAGAPLSAQRPADGARDAIRTRPQVPVRPPTRNNLPSTRPPIADAVEGVLANGLQRRLQLNDDQLNRIRPALRNSLRRRNQLAQESIQRRNQLNQALREDRSEQEIEDLISYIETLR